MEVILLERIEKIGKLGDIVKVKDGFAEPTTSPGVGFENHPGFKLIFDEVSSSHL